MDQIEFTVHGAFPIESDPDRELDVKSFWRQREALAAASGCYVFALQRVKGAVDPYCVGLTHRQFAGEVFNSSNLAKCHEGKEKRPSRPVPHHPHATRSPG